MTTLLVAEHDNRMLKDATHNALTAAKALGGMKSPEAIQALTVALEDRDPAMQYVGVQSMKSITGKDYGPSVEAWRHVAAGQTPPPPQTPSIAEREMPASRIAATEASAASESSDRPASRAKPVEPTPTMATRSLIA